MRKTILFSLIFFICLPASLAFEWWRPLGSGTTGPQGPAGINGVNGTGVNITNITNLNNGKYVWNFSDGYSFTTGNLTGPQGVKGDTGNTGGTGPQGPAGLNGTDGRNGTQFIFQTPFLYNDSTTAYFNITYASLAYVNRSTWTTIDNYPSDCTGRQFMQGIGDILTCALLDNKVQLDGANITSGTIGFSRLPTLTDTHTHDTNNLTNIAGLNNKIKIAWQNITSGIPTIYNITTTTCTGNNKVTAINSETGVVSCGVDNVTADTDTRWIVDLTYLYNDTTKIYLNNTKLNSSHLIDCRNITGGTDNDYCSDSTGSAGPTPLQPNSTYMYNDTVYFYLNVSKMNFSIILDAGQNLTNVAGLNNRITCSGENITQGTINFARLPTLTNTHTLDAGQNLTNKQGLNFSIFLHWANITNAPTIYNITSTTCTGNDKVSAINSVSGVVTCTTDQTSAGGSPQYANNTYMFNNSNYFGVNVSAMNNTIFLDAGNNLTNVVVGLENKTKLSCNNITGATSNLCTITSSASGPTRTFVRQRNTLKQQGTSVTVFAGTDLNLTVAPNKNYTIECALTVYSNATTTGVQLNLSLNYTPTSFVGVWNNPTTTAAMLQTTCSGIPVIRSCSALGTTGVLTPGVRASFNGMLFNGATGGIASVTFRSEIANTHANLTEGSYCVMYDDG